MEDFDILTLDNGKDYVIAKTLEYNGSTYLLLIEVDKDENLLDERKILEKLVDGSEEYLKMIEDNNIYKIVSEKFAKMLLEDLK